NKEWFLRVNRSKSVVFAKGGIMNAEYQQIVTLIQGGADPASALSQVYSISRPSAHKRLYRILGHWEVVAALKISRVKTATQTQKLMKAPFIPPACTTPADP